MKFIRINEDVFLNLDHVRTITFFDLETAGAIPSALVTFGPQGYDALDYEGEMAVDLYNALIPITKEE